MADKLDMMFLLQKDLQKQFNVKFDQNYKNMMVLAAIDELTEFLHETPWKPWKKNQVLNNDKAQDELVDLFHFFMNLCISSDMTPDILYKKYLDKQNTNVQRNKDGY
jgi:dimeric dUTPase (all-alpha-NTP-PPase superfamily)